MIERGLRRVSRATDVGTLWFSPDGARLLFATPTAVTLLDGERTQILRAGAEPWKSARFLDGGRAVLVTAQSSVLRWTPATDERQTLVTAANDETILAADLLAGTLVAWTESPLAAAATR